MQAIRPNRINNEIRVKEVRLTDINGEQIGIYNTYDALKQAALEGLDLVEISPNADPPVCRIMDYGRFLYEKNKLSREQKKKQKVSQIKEVKFRPVTSEGDYQVKLRNLIKFLEDGDKVKVTLRFRGREIMHQQLGMKLLIRLREDVNQTALVEFFPSKLEGRQMLMLLAPKKI